MDSDDDVVIGWAARAEAEAATDTSDDVVLPGCVVLAGGSQAVRQPRELLRTGRFGCWVLGSPDNCGDPDERHLFCLAEMSWTVEGLGSGGPSLCGRRRPSCSGCVGAFALRSAPGLNPG